MSLGGEWWIGRRRGKRAGTIPTETHAAVSTPVRSGFAEHMGREAILEEGDLRGKYDTGSGRADGEVEGPFANERVYPVSQIPVKPTTARQPLSTANPVSTTQPEADDRDGILKAKISGNWVSPMYRFHDPYDIFGVQAEDTSL